MNTGRAVWCDEARISFTTVSVFVHADLSNFKQSTNQQKQIFNKSMKNKTQQPVWLMQSTENRTQSITLEDRQSNIRSNIS